VKVSLNWLKRYVDIDVSTEELCRRMTMAGFEVDGVEDLADTMRNVVAARLVKLEKHPDSDHLQICQMDVGADELVQIVTGAQNVFEGALVPAALHDSDLPCGVHIKKGKLRGVPSNGMLCSGEELCLKESDYPGAEVNGILILKEDAAPGTDMREILHLNDVIIDFSVLANRPDCQSVLGLAREVAVVLNKELKRPVPSYKTVGGSIHDHIAVSVKDFDLCPRYLGRVVTNLRVAPSPDWMQQCLKSAGMRPINNIVDITNFVMLETGQPMHAFDLQDVKGAEIIVRRAATGEQITTLDGKEHNLTDDMLVICDAESPSCIAGIMGGQESEIEDDTKALFFEAAKFRRDSVRRTGRALGIHTESSGRFEKGVDIVNTAYAMERALQLIDELDAGDIIDGTVEFDTESLPGYAIAEVPVMAWSMSDTIVITAYYEYDGVTYQGESRTTSVRDQAMERINSGSYDANTKAVCVTMLNYGAEVQLAFDHYINEEDLANYYLTETQKKIPDVEFTGIVTMPDGAFKPMQSSLSLGDKVTLSFPIRVNDMSGYEVRYAIDGGNEITVPAGDISDLGSVCALTIAAKPLYMRSEYRISIYSVETGLKVYGDIVCNISAVAQAHENSTYHNVVATMLAYGDAVALL